MSVAFRRESDEEHKEPRFELPIPPGPNLVTQRGLDEILAKLASLEANLQVATADDQRESLKREHRYWSTRQSTASLAPIPAADRVAFGTRTKLKMEGRIRAIEIVGSDEADPAAGRIAFTAPLARAILGAAVGDECDFGPNDSPIEILEIEVIAA